jgi:hypothetical protein
MTAHKTGTREEWLAASAELLEREKELTRMSDELARQRRELPWVPVEKEYTLQTEDGARTLAGLFDGRSQLVVYHFMFGPGYTAGCPACSSTADSFNGVLAHLKARDVTMICVSRAPIDKLLAYRQANQGRVGGMWTGTTLILIHHIGARSGTERVTPPQGPPRITVEVGTQTFTVLAEELGSTARAALWPKLVAEWPKPVAGSPDLGAAQAKTTRQFPVFMLTRQD